MICKVCSQDKLPEDFYEDRRVRSGRQARCKKCVCSERKMFEKKRNPEYYQSWKSRPGSIEKIREAKKRYKERHSQKNWAVNAVSNAIRDGRLVKPSTCSACGCFGVIEGHHWDYSRPLDVIWLCESCHKDLHKKERLEDRTEIEVTVL